MEEEEDQRRPLRGFLLSDDAGESPGRGDVWQETANYEPADTGLRQMVWASQKTGVPHGPRVKLSVDANSPNREGSISISVSREPEVAAGDARGFSSRDLERAKRFVVLNHEAPVDLWEERINFKEFERRMRRAP